MAIDPVVVRFAVGGVAEVDRAFDSILKRIERTEVSAARLAKDSARTRVKASEDEGTERARAHGKYVSQVERQEREKDRAFAKLAREVEREEKRARDESLREFERTENYKLAVRRRSAEAAGRIAEQEVRAETRARERAGRAMGHVGRGIGGTLGSMASMAGGALTIGGGFALADIAGKQLSAEKSAALLVNAGTTGGAAPGTIAQALSAASGASAETGMSKDELLQGALKYAQSARGGDFGGALANMSFFGKMSKVTGANIGDIAEAAGVLQSQNADLGRDPKAMQRMLLNTLAQSHAGSMSLVDAAKQIGTMGSVRSSFSGDEAKTQQSLIGLGQIARVGGDVGEAGTFVKDLAMETTIANKKWREKHGTDLVKTDQFGRVSSPEDLVASVLRGTKGNVAQINDLFGKRGSVLFRELSKSYIQGQKTGGVEGGVQAALANMRGVTGATMSPEELDKMLATQLSTPAERLHKAWEKLVTTTGDKLEPILAKLADKAPELIDKLQGIIDAGGKLAEFFLDNPLAGIGAIIAAATAKEIATAAIGEGIKKALATSIGQSVATGGLQVAVAGGAVMIAAEIINAQVNKLEESQKAREDIGAQLGTNLGQATESLEAKAKSGKLTAADIQQAQRLARVSSQGIRQQIADTPGATEIAGQVFGGFAGGDFTGEGAKKSIAAHAKTVDDNQKALIKFQAALLKATESLVRLSTADPSRSVPIDHRTGGGS